ncbi:MAG: FtsX-like permease family protein [Bacilli bacterium]|nr:FtsX-like permease family protein [Bacilli bacterium]
MRIIITHILRNIKEKKGRSLLIILSLMIASVVFILNLTIPNQIVETKAKQSRDAIGKSDVLVASYVPFNINDIKLSNEESKIVGVNDLYTIHKDKTLVIYGTDIKEASNINLIDNIDLLDNEIIISKTTADKYKYKLNDIITIDLMDSKYELKIKDIVEAKGLLSFKSLSGIINNDTYNKITSLENNKYRTYYIDVLNNEKVDDVKKYIQDNNDKKEYMVEKLVDEEKIREDNYYTQFILLVIMIMATIMIFFVVNTLNKMIVMERMPVIGTFRSVGASKFKMNMLLVLENSIYGLLGGSVGALVSILINNFAASMLTGTTIKASVPVNNLISGIIFTICLEVFMSLASIIKSNKYSIKEIMFEGKNSKAGFNIKESIISFILILLSIITYFVIGDTNSLLSALSLIMFWVGIAYFIPTMMLFLSKIICGIAKMINSGSLLMAGKNLGFNKLLISSTRLVVISTSIMLVIVNISMSFNSMIDSYKIQFSGYDGTIRDVSKKYNEYASLNNVDNVKNIEYTFMYSNDDITYNDGKTLDAGPMFLGMDKSNPSIKELDYKINDLKDDECLFDEILLKNNNLKVGDTIDFYLKTQDSHIKVKIVGTVNSYYMSTQREIVVLTDDVFKQKIMEVPFSIEFSVNDNNKVRDTIGLMERELKDPDITIWTIDDFCNIQRKNINSFMSLFYIIIALSLILSFVGIINNQLISFMERTKEIAVLNSICMSKSQLRRMLVIENITSNIVACAFGFGVSIMSLRYMNKLMYGIKMYTDVQYQYNVGLMIMGIVLVVLLSTVIVPIKKMKKINVVEAIKYE